MDEWLRWALGISIPLLVAHGVWATVTIIKLRHTVYGNGQKGIAEKLEDVSKRVHDLRDQVQRYQGGLELVEKLVDVIQANQRQTRRG